MPYTKYELHDDYDADFPLRFHFDEKKPIRSLSSHWHEHIEILFIVSGVCEIEAGNVVNTLYPGELILFSPNCAHNIRGLNGKCAYYCITVDIGFCTKFGIPVNRGQFSAVHRNGLPCDCYSRIVELMNEKPLCYREEVKALCLQMVAVIYREYKGSEGHANAINKMVSNTIQYLNAHFSEPITIDELSEFVGFSKYYFCRRFKEVTGKTVVDYLNFLRCINAKRLIKSGQYNVSESAYMSGFNNLSYFTKVYVKHMGNAPSNEKVTKQDN